MSLNTLLKMPNVHIEKTYSIVLTIKHLRKDASRHKSPNSNTKFKRLLKTLGFNLEPVDFFKLSGYVAKDRSKRPLFMHTESLESKEYKTLNDVIDGVIFPVSQFDDNNFPRYINVSRYNNDSHVYFYPKMNYTVTFKKGSSKGSTQTKLKQEILTLTSRKNRFNRFSITRLSKFNNSFKVSIDPHTDNDGLGMLFYNQIQSPWAGNTRRNSRKTAFENSAENLDTMMGYFWGMNEQFEKFEILSKRHINSVIRKHSLGAKQK